MQGRSRVSIRASPSASGGACTSGDLKQHAGAQGTGTSNHRHWQACMGRHAETLCLGARSAANKGGSDFDITLTQQERLAKHRPLGSALHRLVCSSPPRPWRSEGANRALPCRFWTPASMVRAEGGDGHVLRAVPACSAPRVGRCVWHDYVRLSWQRASPASHLAAAAAAPPPLAFAPPSPLQAPSQAAASCRRSRRYERVPTQLCKWLCPTQPDMCTACCRARPAKPCHHRPAPPRRLWTGASGCGGWRWRPST